MFDFLKAKATGAKVRVFNANSVKDAKRAGFRFVDYLVEGIQVDSYDEKQNGNIYEVYRASSRATARTFLDRIPQGRIPKYYYVIVETPAGNLGKDFNGIFDEPA